MNLKRKFFVLSRWSGFILLSLLTAVACRADNDPSSVVLPLKDVRLARSFFPPYPEDTSSAEEKAIVSDDHPTRELFTLPARVTLGFYRHVGRKAVKSRCPMDPSCSTYSLQAHQQRGLVLGALLTADRLFRCGHDLRWYSRITEQGRGKLLDPVPIAAQIGGKE